MQLEIHPTALQNIGRLTASQARPFMKRMFTKSEIERIIENAGCVHTKESWNPYRGLRSPFLVFEE